MTFDVAPAQIFDGGPYDLVTSFDCLHDMGDPLGAARQVIRAAAHVPGGRPVAGR